MMGCVERPEESVTDGLVLHVGVKGTLKGHALSVFSGNRFSQILICVVIISGKSQTLLPFSPNFVPKQTISGVSMRSQI